MAETKTGERPDRAAAVGAPANPRRLEPDDLDPILDKLKLLEFGLYGLQQYRRGSGMDDEDFGPFYRLAEEIGGDVLELQRLLKTKSVTRVDP